MSLDTFRIAAQFGRVGRWPLLLCLVPACSLTAPSSRELSERYDAGGVGSVVDDGVDATVADVAETSVLDDVGGEGRADVSLADNDPLDGNDGDVLDEESQSPSDSTAAADGADDVLTDDGAIDTGRVVEGGFDANTVMPSKDLIQYFSFDDGARPNPKNTQAIDSSEREKHATLHGEPQWIADGQVGGALRLDGKVQYVELQPDLLFELTAATVACWYRVHVLVGTQYGPSWQRVFDFGSGTDNWWYFAPKTWPIAPEPALPRTATMHAGVPLDVFGQAAVPGNEWHHVAVVWSDEQKLFLYQDGELVGAGETPFPLSAFGRTTQNWIGRSQFNALNDGTSTLDPNFNGDVDEFRVYARALDAAEVLTLASQGR